MKCYLWIIVLLLASCQDSTASEAIVPTVMAAEHLTTLTADEHAPVWSPDGTRFAFVGHHEGNPEVYIQAVGSDNAVNVSNSPQDDFAPVWSPDGRYLLYYHRTQRVTLLPELLRLVDVETGERHTLRERPGNYQLHHWTPDGETLYFSSQDAVWRYDIPTRSLEALYEITITPGVWQGIEQVIVRAERIVWAVRSSAGETTYEIFQTDLDTGTRQSISEQALRLPIMLSPDGRYLAVHGVGGSTSPLTVFDLQTQTSETFAIAGLQVWGWSQANQLMWSQQITDQPAALMALTPGSSPKQVLSINHAISGGAWSPTDADQFALTTYAGLYVVDVSGGRFSNILYGQGRLGNVVWSPDGAKIAIPAYTYPFYKPRVGAF